MLHTYFISSYVTLSDLLNAASLWSPIILLSNILIWWPLTNPQHLPASLSPPLPSVCFNSLDNNYVLSHYKTELCKKPPRLCRQGYACPYYHNSKDRRRSPHKHKYRCSVTSRERKIFEDHGDVFCSVVDVFNRAVVCSCHRRALPCPAVKQSEEWGDPSKCEGAEGCQYCHTRTEQQFHPEVCLIVRRDLIESRPEFKD